MCVQVEEEGWRSGCRPIVLLNWFSAEKAKTELSPTQHSCCTASATPANSPIHVFNMTGLHSNTVLLPATVLAVSLSLLSVWLHFSHCPEKTMAQCYRQTVLTVSRCCLDTAGSKKKKKKNHINISLGERISASNGIGLEGKRLELAEGREDEAGQRWCIIEEGALPFWKHAAAEMEKFRQKSVDLTDFCTDLKCYNYFFSPC